MNQLSPVQITASQADTTVGTYSVSGIDACAYHDHKLLVMHIKKSPYTSLDWVQKASLIKSMPQVVLSYNYLSDFRTIGCQYDHQEVKNITRIDFDISKSLTNLSNLGDILTAYVANDQNHEQLCVIRDKINDTYGIQFLQVFLDAKEAMTWLGYTDVAPADVNL